MTHKVHESHSHNHSENCGHLRIQHNGHVDFLHNGHLHSSHEGHFDECVLAISESNPEGCHETACLCSHDDCGHEKIPHGDHFDFVINGRLHHRHGNHCDDHGAIAIM